VESIDDFNERINNIKYDLWEKANKASNEKVRLAYHSLANRYEFARRVFNQFFEDGTISIEDLP